jgi:hypothetical protein
MDERSLTHLCQNGTCYCDWRLTIYDCVDSAGLKIIYLVMIGFSALVSLFCKLEPLETPTRTHLSLLAFSIFLHRFIYKGHRLFDFNSASVLKPKPIDCLMFFLTVFNLCKHNMG